MSLSKHVYVPVLAYPVYFYTHKLPVLYVKKIETDCF
jgi:hypothetical protein